MIYCALFGIGKIIFGQVGMGLALLVGAALCVAFIFWDLNRRGFESLT
jgi:TM2 domain-containing membrane protein YozV